MSDHRAEFEAWVDGLLPLSRYETAGPSLGEYHAYAVQYAFEAWKSRSATIDALREALTQAEACMTIVEPRSDKAEYLRILGVVRAALEATK